MAQINYKRDKYTYRVTWSEEDGEYIGLCAEFPSLSWLAQTQDEALKGVIQLVSEVIIDMQKNAEPVPEPIAIKQFSGKFMIRVPPEVHRQLAIQAQEAGVSLNRLASARLSSI
jgi:predicted HicB family RNase H-like nuclease